MEIKIYKSLNGEVKPSSIPKAIESFYLDSGIDIDYKGFIESTLEKFAMATYLNRGDWDLWLAHKNGDVKSYIIASVDKASNNNLCYFIHQAWIDKEYRHNGLSKETWPKLKDRAKQLFCHQMIIYSIRNYEAYKRFLGEDLTPYSEMLHLKLED